MVWELQSPNCGLGVWYESRAVALGVRELRCEICRKGFNFVFLICFVYCLFLQTLQKFTEAKPFASTRFEEIHPVDFF